MEQHSQRVAPLCLLGVGQGRFAPCLAGLVRQEPGNFQRKSDQCQHQPHAAYRIASPEHYTEPDEQPNRAGCQSEEYSEQREDNVYGQPESRIPGCGDGCSTHPGRNEDAEARLNKLLKLFPRSEFSDRAKQELSDLGLGLAPRPAGQFVNRADAADRLLEGLKKR